MAVLHRESLQKISMHHELKAINAVLVSGRARTYVRTNTPLTDRTLCRVSRVSLTHATLDTCGALTGIGYDKYSMKSMGAPFTPSSHSLLRTISDLNIAICKITLKEEKKRL